MIKAAIPPADAVEVAEEASKPKKNHADVPSPKKLTLKEPLYGFVARLARERHADFSTTVANMVREAYNRAHHERGPFFDVADDVVFTECAKRLDIPVDSFKAKVNA